MNQRKTPTKYNHPIILDKKLYTEQQLSAMSKALQDNYACWKLANYNDVHYIEVDIDMVPIYRNVGKRTDLILNTVSHLEGVSLPADVANVMTGRSDETIALTGVKFKVDGEIGLWFMVSHYKSVAAKKKSLERIYAVILKAPEVKANAGEDDDVTQVSQEETKPPVTREELWCQLSGAILWYCADNADLTVYMESIRAAFNVTPTIRTSVKRIPPHSVADLYTVKLLFFTQGENFPALAAIYYRLEYRRLENLHNVKPLDIIVTSFDNSCDSSVREQEVAISLPGNAY